MCVPPPLTQFESSGQSSDDGDWVRGVGAELVERREEGVPLVLELQVREETRDWSGNEERLQRERENRLSPPTLCCTYIYTGRRRVEFVLWQRRRWRARGARRGTLVQEDAVRGQAVLPQVPAARGDTRSNQTHSSTCTTTLFTQQASDKYISLLHRKTASCYCRGKISPAVKLISVQTINVMVQLSLVRRQKHFETNMWS